MKKHSGDGIDLKMYEPAMRHLIDAYIRAEESEQVSLSLDWAHLMADYLTELDEYFRGGQLTRDQEERYRSLLGKLKDVRPIIQQLRLYPPPVALDAVTLT